MHREDCEANRLSQDTPYPALLRHAKDGDVLPSLEDVVLRKRTDAKVQGVVFFYESVLP